jgi:hypothetical protein
MKINEMRLKEQLKESIEQKGDQTLVPHGYNPSYSEG